MPPSPLLTPAAAGQVATAPQTAALSCFALPASLLLLLLLLVLLATVAHVSVTLPLPLEWQALPLLLALLPRLSLLLQPLALLLRGRTAAALLPPPLLDCQWPGPIWLMEAGELPSLLPRLLPLALAG